MQEDGGSKLLIPNRDGVLGWAVDQTITAFISNRIHDATKHQLVVLSLTRGVVDVIGSFVPYLFGGDSSIMGNRVDSIYGNDVSCALTPTAFSRSPKELLVKGHDTGRFAVEVGRVELLDGIGEVDPSFLG